MNRLFVGFINFPIRISSIASPMRRAKRYFLYLFRKVSHKEHKD